MNEIKMTAKVLPDLMAETLEAPAHIRARKSEHIAIVSSGRGRQSSVATGFDNIRFEHNALPEIDFDKIDTQTTLLGCKIAAPIMISAMTGGPREAENINAHIAEACRALSLPMSVGSQRIALDGNGHSGFSKNLRNRAGSVPIFANLGAVQLNYGMGVDHAKSAVEMIEADALFFHLNPLQEAIQIGGDADFYALLPKIEAVIKALDVPVGIKEVGAGLSASTGQKLLDIGVTLIDVAGVGGTSWSKVEAQRGDERLQNLAEPFADWGIPTTMAIQEMEKIMPKGKTLIASGGVRHGLDVARAIRLGADMAGQAAGALAGARMGSEALVAHLDDMITQLKIAMFCTGSENLAALRQAPLQPS